jgi:hypothetical protein
VATRAVGVAVGRAVAGVGVAVGVFGGRVGVTVGVGAGPVTVNGTAIWQKQLKSVKKIWNVPVPPTTKGIVNVNLATPEASVVAVPRTGSPGLLKMAVIETFGRALTSSAVTTVPTGPELGVNVTRFSPAGVWAATSLAAEAANPRMTANRAAIPTRANIMLSKRKLIRHFRPFSDFLTTGFSLIDTAL